MIDPHAQLQALLQPVDRTPNPFPPASRYNGVPLAAIETNEGRIVVFLRRRFVPPPERFVSLQEHAVAQGDRLDGLAFRYLGDPEQFWRLCDANRALRPDELTAEIGRTIRITLPEGMG